MAHNYGTFVCKYCKTAHAKTASRQAVCTNQECQKKQALSVQRAYRRRLREEREPTLCEWCDKPLPPGKRKYHPECFDEKNRARMCIYYWKQVAIRVGPEEAARRRKTFHRRKTRRQKSLDSGSVIH